jgi:hypothetical protein
MRAQAVASHMLAGSGEWWMFGAWGRWYRSGMDGNWFMCAPPAGRGGAAPPPPGMPRPPVPPTLLPAGPDLYSGPVFGTGLFATPPPPPVAARLQHAIGLAGNVHPAMFPMNDPGFAPGAPATMAACWYSVLWCAGSPAVLPDSPVRAMFGGALAPADAAEPHWCGPVELPRLVALYAGKLRMGDPGGANHIVRVVWETAEALRGDPRFRPRADALSGIAAATATMVSRDMAGARFGDGPIVQEWLRRCPPQASVSLLRETMPGQQLRLALYDLSAAVAAAMPGAGGQAETRHYAAALLGADLQPAPHAVPAVLPWLDPETAAIFQAVLAQSDHPLRAIWPSGATVPAALAAADPEQLHGVVAAAYTLDLAWCRLAGINPGVSGFVVPAALMSASTSSGPSAWEIIEAARAHLAEQRKADEGPGEISPPPATELAGGVPPLPGADTGGSQEAMDPFEATFIAPDVPPLPGAAAPAPGEPLPPPIPPLPPEAQIDQPAAAPPDAPGTRLETPGPVVPGTRLEAPGTPEPGPAASGIRFGPAPRTPRAQVSGDPFGAPPATSDFYGLSFLSGPDDLGRLVTELRRRGTWVRSLPGVSQAAESAPAVLLVGEPSTGQRRATRIIARALADAESTSPPPLVGGNEFRTVHADEFAGAQPRELAERVAAFEGQTMLLEGLDTLILDDPRGPSFATALYRARVEEVSKTTLVATCGPDRLADLREGYPELLNDFRPMRLPDFDDAAARADLAWLLARERHLQLSEQAWKAVREDLSRLRGRGRLTNARLVEAYLERARNHHLSGVEETGQIIKGRMSLNTRDFEGVAAEIDGR